jgi:hypothetical protein
VILAAIILQAQNPTFVYVMEWWILRNDSFSNSNRSIIFHDIAVIFKCHTMVHVRDNLHRPL